jgi:hypothetical protein
VIPEPQVAFLYPSFRGVPEVAVAPSVAVLVPESLALPFVAPLLLPHALVLAPSDKAAALQRMNFDTCLMGSLFM